MKQPLLEVKNLNIVVPKKGEIIPLVASLSFDLFPGECMGLVGESGSGKSMTALSIMQLLPQVTFVYEKSQIKLDGIDLLALSEKKMRQIRGRRIAMIFQDAMSAFNPVLTVGQQMQEIPDSEGRDHAYALLAEVGISDPERCYKSYPHQLSGGMRQRAMIAMALCSNPDLIIADEPTTALDVTIQAQVIELLMRLKSTRKVALLFISHDLAVVSQVADTITVMRQGESVEQASPRAFFAKPQHPYSRQLLSAIPQAQEEARPVSQSKVALRVNDLRVYFPVRKGILKRKVEVIKAVDKVSFDLPLGQTLALVGESGSGKTTTAKAIVALLKKTAGTITLPEGCNLRQDVQMIFQDPYTALNPRRMIADSILEGMAAQAVLSSHHERLARVDELLEQVGLSPEYKWCYPHEFSGGERQRICIARALALKPKWIILDEPTSALDVSIQMQVLKLLKELQANEGFSYLLITHDLSVVSHMAHYVAVMYQGKIVESGVASAVLKKPVHDYTRRLLASVPTFSYLSE